MTASGEENEYPFAKIVGLKFNPIDGILVDHYLAEKVCGGTKGSVSQFIKEAEVYQCEPSHLPSFEPYDFGDKTWKKYFFTTLKMVNTKKGKNVHRLVAGGVGFWKITGKIVDVEDKDKNKIGNKTSLAYYKNIGPKDCGESTKTNWLMTEYRLSDVKYAMLKKEYNLDDEKKERLALCVVYDKKRGKCESENEFGDEKDLLSPFSENPSNASCSYNIAIPNTDQNMPISEKGCYSQLGANNPIMNSLNSEPADSAPWLSLPSAQNSFLNSPENLIMSCAQNQSIAFGSSSPFNFSSNHQDILESLFHSHIRTLSHWNPNFGESSLGTIHRNNTVMGYSLDDQDTVSTVQIPSGHSQDIPVMGYSQGGN